MHLNKLLLLCLIILLLSVPTFLGYSGGGGGDELPDQGTVPNQESDSGEDSVDWNNYCDGCSSKDDLLKAAENGNLKKENFKDAIENTGVGVSDLEGPAVKNNLNAIKDLEKQGQLTKDQIAAVEDKSKLGDLGNYDSQAMQQAIQDEYPNAQVEPADGMKLTDDGKLTYQGSDIDLSSFEEDKNINVQDGELMVDKKPVSEAQDMEGVETADTQGKSGLTININQLRQDGSMFPGSPGTEVNWNDGPSAQDDNDDSSADSGSQDTSEQDDDSDQLHGLSMSSVGTYDDWLQDGTDFTYYAPDYYATAEAGELQDQDTELTDARNVQRTPKLLAAAEVGEGTANYSSGTAEFTDAGNAYFANESYHLGSADTVTLKGESTYYINNATNITVTDENMHIESAETVTLGDTLLGSQVTNATVPFTFNHSLFNFSFTIDDYDRIEAEHAGIISLDERLYHNVSDATILFNQSIIYANITSGKDTAEYAFDNPRDATDAAIRLDRGEQAIYAQHNDSLFFET